jgi:antirestriction protein ArdC
MAKPDFDIYQHVTTQIIEAMEAGVSPWRAPWSGADQAALFPLRSSGEAYRGINVLMLWLAAHVNGFTSAHWFTFRQAKDLGAHVRKGSKSSTVVKYGTVERENDEGEAVAIPYARAYRVFNADQIKGLPEHFYIRPEPQEDLGTRPLPEVDSFFQAVGARVTHGGLCACYIPAEDRVQMPPVSAFMTAQHYTATLCHEITHWTGHRLRLDRFKVGATKADYAREELIAEIGSCFLGARIGVEPTIEEAASYLDSWLAVLKEDKRAIFKAASAAQRAADFVLEAAAAGGATVAAA